MNSENEDGFYKLELRTIVPEKVGIDEMYKVKYLVNNLSKERKFLGGTIPIVLSSPVLGLGILVNHPLEILSLDPRISYKIPPFKERPIAPGLTVLTYPRIPVLGDVDSRRFSSTINILSIS